MPKISGWEAVTGAVGRTQAELYLGLANAHVPFVDAAIKLTCNINEAHANDIAKSAYDRAFINTLCGLTANPVPQGIPGAYSGGQCPGVSYNIEITSDRYFTNNGDLIQTDYVRNFNHYGAITAVYDRVRKQDRRPSLDGYYFVIEHHDETGTIAEEAEWFIAGHNIHHVIKNIVVTRNDDGIDDCGNVPDSYPPSPPRPDNFTQPVEYSPSLPSGTYPEVDIVGDLPGDTNLDFPICVNFGDFEICLDYDGIYFNNNDSPSENPTEESPPIEDVPFNPDNFDDTPSVCSSDAGEATAGQPVPDEGVQLCESEVDNLKWLLVTIVQLPTANKRVLHANPEHDDHFAGYLIWKIVDNGTSYYMPSIPIRKVHNAFRPPKDVNGYAIYTTWGAKMNIRELKEKESA